MSLIFPVDGVSLLGDFREQKNSEVHIFKKNDNDLIHQTVVYYNNLFVAGIYGR